MMHSLGISGEEKSGAAVKARYLWKMVVKMLHAYCLLAHKALCVCTAHIYQVYMCLHFSFASK